MSILFRTIARQYLVNVIVLFAILFAFVLVIDFSLNFDEFARIANEQLGKVPGLGGFLRRLSLMSYLMFDLWWPRAFLLYSFLLGFVLVAAMGFTLSQMARHRELVACLAGGLSLWKVARPILVVAAGLCVLQIVDRELILPRLAPLLIRDKGDAGKHEIDLLQIRLIPDAKGRVFYSDSFDPNTKELRGLYVWERDSEGLLTRRITATLAHWDKGAWRLVDGKADLREKGVLVTRSQDAIETDLDPDTLTLRRFEAYVQNLSTARLTEMMRSYRAQGANQARISRLDQIRWSRPSLVLCNLLALVICTPFFLRREPSNMLLQALMCAPVALVTLVGGTLGAMSAIPALPPAVSAFVPVLVLLPIAIAGASLVKS